MDARKDKAPVQTWVEANGSVNFEKPCKDKPNYKMAFLLSTIAVLLLSVAVSLSVYFSAAQKSSLAELNLEEGESLTYRVDHEIQVQGSNVQNAAIRLLVGIVVHNKTSEEYWFLIKLNLSHVGDVEIGSMKTLTEYFLVRLPLAARTSSNKTTCSFEVYGHAQTNTELIRLLYATLEQLFPSLKRELYENVDGQEATKSKPLYPEDSPLLPGSVKMHREANTSDENTLVIKNHFDSEDFIDMSPDIDLDLKYTDIALINKSNGMMSESHLNLSKQLNFGEEMRNNDNLNVNQKKITLMSHASRVEGIFLEYEESKTIVVLLFTKLVVPKSNVTFSVNDKPEAGLQPNSSSADFPPPSPSQQQNFTGNLQSISLRRARRAVRGVSWKYTEPISLRVKRSFTLFQKKVIGVNVKGEGSFWLEPRHGEIGVTFGLFIGGRYLGNVIMERYNKRHMKDGRNRYNKFQWGKTIGISVPVFFLRLGADFSLRFSVNGLLDFPQNLNSLSPAKFGVEVEPSCEVTVSIEAYVSAYVIRAGAYGDGTLVRAGLPVVLSYQATRSPGRKWCVQLYGRMTALELRAGIFYQWRRWLWGWGTRHRLYEFGKWSAYRRNWKLLEQCG